MVARRALRAVGGGRTGGATGWTALTDPRVEEEAGVAAQAERGVAGCAAYRAPRAVRPAKKEGGQTGQATRAIRAAGTVAVDRGAVEAGTRAEELADGAAEAGRVGGAGGAAAREAGRSVQVAPEGAAQAGGVG